MLEHGSMYINKEKLGPLSSFGESMFYPEISDLGVDIAEIGLDSFIDNPIIKEIPIIKFISAVNKAGVSIKDAFEARKQVVFLQQINNGTANKNEIEKRKAAYLNGEAWFYREVEKTVIFLSRHARIEKVKIQAKLYLDYINGIISEERYYECLEVLDIIIVGDVPLLLEIYREQSSLVDLSGNLQEKLKEIKTHFDHVKCSRLNAVGLICPVSRGLIFGASISNDYLITDLGKYFCEIVLHLASEIN